MEKNLCVAEQRKWHKWKAKVIRDIVKIDINYPPIEKLLRKGISDLKKMEIIVKQADKNLGLVVMRGDIYNSFLRQQLQAPTFILVDSYPHHDIVRRLDNIIRSKRSIHDYVKEIWITHAAGAKEPNPFYIIPKIHKQALGVRPITAQHSYALAPVSKSLAKLLQPEVEKIDTIAKNSTSVLRRLESMKFSEPFVFVTFDVIAMYPSINLKDAMKVLHHNLPQLRTDFGVWGKLLQLVMYNNYVSANGRIYRQMEGTATGTQVAPQFANLYAHFKYKHIFEDKNIKFLDRFIEDGLMIMTSRPAAENLMEKLNNFGNLKFTWEISEKEATYMDITVYKGPRYKRHGILDVKVYFKPCNRLLYLPACSNHPVGMKYGIVIGEAIRCLRNTSSKENWLNALHFIFKGLLARGYNGTLIQKQWKKVRFEDRHRYLSETTTKKRPVGFLVKATFHPDTNRHWKEIVNKFPIEKIMIQKRINSFSRKQLAVMNNWPPKLLWHNFKKIGHRMISARTSWQYPYLRSKKRTRCQQEQTGSNKKQRRIL